MIDHLVTIAGEDVSKHVISVNVEQSTETDSDPGKITIVLANVDAVYTAKFVNQLDPIVVKLYNFVYSSEEEFEVFTGKVTDSTPDDRIGEIVIKGECDLGHLADALPKDFDFTTETMFGDVTAFHVLAEILDSHDTTITLDFDVEDKDIKPVTYSAEMTYQDVLEDIRQLTGAIYYFDEGNILRYKDPTKISAYMDLDPFVSNPSQAKSIMGYCNEVTIIGYDAIDDSVEGFQTAHHNPISATAQDEESIALHNKLIAPVRYVYNIHDQEQAQAAADQLLAFYKQRYDTLTELVVEGRIPPLQSLVKFTSFEPIDSASDPITLYGVVIEKRVSYSADGLQTTIILHPRTDAAQVAADIAALDA